MTVSLLMKTPLKNMVFPTFGRCSLDSTLEHAPIINRITLLPVLTSILLFLMSKMTPFADLILEGFKHVKSFLMKKFSVTKAVSLNGRP